MIFFLNDSICPLGGGVSSDDFLVSFILTLDFDSSDHREMETWDKIRTMSLTLQLTPQSP